MSSLHAFVTQTLADGRIDDAELPTIKEVLARDNRLDLDDVKLLVELYCSARQRSGAFEDFFFAVLERVLLEDGEIQPSEQFYLLKMIYSDREIRDCEREFLRRLQAKAAKQSPAFDALCQTAFKAPDRNWCAGGRER